MGNSDRILIVHGAPTSRQWLSNQFRAQGFLCEHTASIAQSLQCARDGASLVIVLGGDPGEANVPDLCRTLRREGVTNPILAVVQSSSASAVLALEEGAQEAFSGGLFDFQALLERVRTYFRNPPSSEAVAVRHSLSDSCANTWRLANGETVDESGLANRPSSLQLGTDAAFIMAARKERDRLRADLLADKAGAPWMQLRQADRKQLRARLEELTRFLDAYGE